MGAVCSSLVRILLLLLEFNPFGIKFFESKKNSSQRNPEGISARKKNFSDAEEFKHEGIEFEYENNTRVYFLMFLIPSCLNSSASELNFFFAKIPSGFF